MTPIAPPPASTPAAAPPAPGTDSARVHTAAQSFEAIFVRQILASARQTNFADELWGQDQGHDTFATMRDDQYAEIVAKTGALGLGRQVERQLTGQSASDQPGRAPTQEAAP